MILDNESLLSDKLDISADLGGGVGAGGPSTNVYDLSVLAKTYDGVQIQRHIGKAAMIPFINMVNAAITSGDGATHVDFVFEEDDAEGFGTAEEVYRMRIAIARLVIGYHLPICYIPREVQKRYFRMQYLPVGGTLNAGVVTSGVVAGVDAAYQG